MQESTSSIYRNPEVELDNDDSTRFNKSLQEMKDLCSQLHCAADYCETSFLNAKYAQKKTVMENTKEYLCRAVVTVVDHLGSVSANLDYRVTNNSPVSQTEFRINCLNQVCTFNGLPPNPRLVSCQQYSHELALTNVCRRANFPRYHPRYIFPPTEDLERSNQALRKSRTPIAAKTISKHEFETEEEVPLYLYTCNQKLLLTKNSSTADTNNTSSPSALPVRDGLPVLPKPRNPSFHFEDTRKLKRKMLNWKLVQNNDIWSLIRNRNRAM